MYDRTRIYSVAVTRFWQHQSHTNPEKKYKRPVASPKVTRIDLTTAYPTISQVSSELYRDYPKYLVQLRAARNGDALLLCVVVPNGKDSVPIFGSVRTPRNNW